MVKKQNVVVVKNYLMRNRLVAFLSFPAMIFVSVFVTVPTLFVSSNIGVLVIATVISEILAIILLTKFADGSLVWNDVRNKLYLKNFSVKKSLAGFILGVIAFAGLQFFAYLFSLAGLSMTSSDTSNSVASLEGVWRYVILVGFVFLIVPITEEIFFRGFILGSVKKSYPDDKKRAVFWGTLISVVYFSVAHYQGLDNFSSIFLLIWIGLIALVNCWSTLKTDSLNTAIVTHCTYNGITVLFMLIAPLIQ